MISQGAPPHDTPLFRLDCPESQPDGLSEPNPACHLITGAAQLRVFAARARHHAQTQALCKYPGDSAAGLESQAGLSLLRNQTPCVYSG